MSGQRWVRQDDKDLQEDIAGRSFAKQKSMKRKIYTSMSIPHFSVGGTRVAFTPLSTRSSYFETTDEALQRKIESHPWFGDKFKLQSEEDTATAAAAAENGGQQNELKEMSFSTLADAKEWLAEEHNVVRSNIKKKEDAIAAGKAIGVEITIGVPSAQHETTADGTAKE